MNVWLAEGKGGVRQERTVWEFGIHMYTLLFLKQITNKNHCKKPGGQVNSVILIIQIFLQVRSYVEAQYEKGLRLAPHRRA